ncbi:MAG: hypothetical protein Kow0069_03270 [Promethearchaeota archaeon]
MKGEAEEFVEEFLRLQAELEALRPAELGSRDLYEARAGALERAMDEIQRMWNAARARAAELAGEEFDWATIPEEVARRKAVRRTPAPDAGTRAAGRGRPRTKAAKPAGRAGSGGPKKATAGGGRWVPVLLSKELYGALCAAREEMGRGRTPSWDEVVERLLEERDRACELAGEVDRLRRVVEEIAVKNASLLAQGAFAAASPPPPAPRPSRPPPAPARPDGPPGARGPPQSFAAPPPQFARAGNWNESPRACYADVVREMKQLFSSGRPLLRPPDWGEE